MSNKYLQEASIKAQQKLDTLTNVLKGRRSIRTMSFQFTQEVSEDQDLVGEFVDALSGQVAIESGMEVLIKAYNHRDAPEHQIASDADYVAAMVRYTTREHHDSDERVVVLSGHNYAVLQHAGVLSVIKGDPGVEIDEDDAFLRSSATLNGAAVLIDPYSPDSRKTLVLKDGWFNYSGSGVNVSGTDAEGQFILDRLTEVDPTKFVVILH